MQGAAARMALNQTSAAGVVRSKGKLEASIPSFMAAVQTSEWQPAAGQFRTEDVLVGPRSTSLQEMSFARLMLQ